MQRARAQLKQAERERRARERREQRRFTAERRSHRARWLLSGGAVLLLAVIAAGAVFTPVMAVREVQVRGAQTIDAAQLQQALARFEGVPLGLVRDGEVRAALAPYPLVERFAVERIPPATLVVSVKERSAVIALQREGGFELVDPAGVPLATVPERPAGVPLAGEGLHDTASEGFLAAATVVRDMPAELRQQLEGVSAPGPQQVGFSLQGGIEVVWGDATDTQRKAAVLRSLLGSLGPVSLIDVSAPDAPIFR